MRPLLVVAAMTVALLGPVPPSVARPDREVGHWADHWANHWADLVAEPAARIDPLPLPAPGACVVPATDLFESVCPGPRSPGKLGADAACNLPVVYLGGPPGPCPDRREPPESRVIPVGPALLSR